MAKRKVFFRNDKAKVTVLPSEEPLSPLEDRRKVRSICFCPEIDWWVTRIILEQRIRRSRRVGSVCFCGGCMVDEYGY